MSWAVITGASGGIGLEMVKTLAEREPSLHFLLIARREDRLQEICDDLRKQKIRAEYLAIDLSAPGGTQKVENRIRSSGYAVRHLINNAGFGWYGRFETQQIENIEEMIALNITALTLLTRRLIPLMETDGHIINIASSAGFAPIGGFAVYAATKAFVLSFSMALDAELRRSREITVSAICPGPVETGFFDRAQMKDSSMARSYFRERPQQTAKRAIRGAARGRPLIPTGIAAWSFRFISWVVPRKVIARTMVTHADNHEQQ
jgi:short-subunit dehydrogenase